MLLAGSIILSIDATSTADLRESGAIEQDADIIMFIHRPQPTEADVTNANKAEIIIAKHRNGPLGTVKMRWSGETVSFLDESDDSSTASFGGDTPFKTPAEKNTELQKGMVQMQEISDDDMGDVPFH